MVQVDATKPSHTSPLSWSSLRWFDVSTVFPAAQGVGVDTHLQIGSTTLSERDQSRPSIVFVIVAFIRPGLTESVHQFRDCPLDDASMVESRVIRIGPRGPIVFRAAIPVCFRSHSCKRHTNEERVVRGKPAH